MTCLRRIVKTVFALFFIAAAIIFVLIAYFSYKLPSTFTVPKGSVSSVLSGTPLSVKYASEIIEVKPTSSSAAGKYDVRFDLLGVIPVSNATVNEVEDDTVCIIGKPFGIKLYSAGVMVVGTSDIISANETVNPAKKSDIRVGDLITSIDGVETHSNTDVAEAVESSEGREMVFAIERNGKKLKKTVTAVYSAEDGKFKIGIWVRDSSAGIGTLTYYDAYTNTVGGLGHAVCDSDTGETIPLDHGELVRAEILDISRGEKGCPGELRGCFLNGTIGNFTLNSNAGVYGAVSDVSAVDGINVKVGYKHDIEVGKAQIYTTVKGSVPQFYDCYIQRVELNDNGLIKNMTVKITDKNLLSLTGGIVQGMSGSPIVQNGKFIGAVTHVFVDDPTMGYAIFAENMISESKKASVKQSVPESDAA